MEFEKLVNDSLMYTRDAFAGHWGRWLIFILLGLPFALIQFVVDPEQIISGTTIRWDLVPWGSIAALVAAGILASFFLSGYMVRIYRGVIPAPDFTGWAALFIDGIRLGIVVLVWLLPVILVLLAGLALVLGSLSGGLSSLSGIVWLLLLLALVEVALIIIAALYVNLGAIRFARTGSMVEGWRFRAITGIIRQIGWGSYLLALILFIVISILFNVVVSIAAGIPYIGWIVPVCLAPLLTVFGARYFTLVYEAGVAPPPGAAPVHPARPAA